MSDEESQRMPDNKLGREPRLIERARRIGWGLIALAAGALLADRLGVPGGALVWRGLAIGAAMIGGLAIVNVALVRGLYAQIAKAPHAQPPLENIADAD